MISRAQEPEQLYAKGGIASIRQPYFLGKAVKKLTKGAKKVLKSPLGKAALIGGLGSWGLGMGPLGSIKGAGWMKGIPAWFGEDRMLGKMFRNKEGAWSPGKIGLGALLAAGTTLPFMAGDDDEEVVEEAWDVTPGAVSNIRQMAADRHPSLAFLPQSQYAMPGFFTGAKDGGRVGIANGGGAAEAQAEQMLRMEYQKYRNQGGTMSYQQFKMQVLKQAQQQGPMAQAQPQMMSKGGRTGFFTAGLAAGDDISPGTSTSGGLRHEGNSAGGERNIITNTGGDGANVSENNLVPVDESWGDKLRGAFSIFNPSFNLDQAADNEEEKVAILQERFNPDDPSKWAQGGRVGLLGGGPVPGSTVAGYTTPAGYNKFNYPTGGVRVAAANGGIMPLLDLGGKEKDYRNEGGFVGIGRKEKADDVPARLSKNEFVFTADAVRNAGGGDVDAGAEVMDNMMKHLESGGQISEESQGLGAQGMYDNMRQLETRIA